MWRRIGIAGFIGLLLAGLVFLVVRNDEPTYQGRRISLILDDRAAGKLAVPFEEVLSEVGTNALPYIVRNLARNDSTWHKKYRDARLKLPKFLQNILPPAKPCLWTHDGMRAFGYFGASAVPQLGALLKHNSASVRQAAAGGLGVLRGRTKAANAAIPALGDALSDPDRNVQLQAAGALTVVGPDALAAIPALRRVLAHVAAVSQTNDFSHLRAVAARGLGYIGSPAKEALPELRAALQTPNPHLRGEAAVAIWRIDGDADAALPVLLQEMRNTDEFFKWDWIVALEEMGPRARAAIPQLQKELTQNTQPWVLEHVAKALLKIDPDAAAKVGVFPPAVKK